MKNKTKIYLLVTLIVMGISQIIIASNLFTSFLNISFDLNKFIARIGEREIQSIVQPGSNLPSINETNNNLTPNVSVQGDSTPTILQNNTSIGSNTGTTNNQTLSDIKNEITDKIDAIQDPNITENSILDKLQDFSGTEQKCFRGSLRKLIKNSSDTDQIKVIFSYNKTYSDTSKIINTLNTFLANKGIQSKNLKLIKAYSFKIKKGELRDLLSEFIKNKIIDISTPLSDTNDISDEAPFTNCPIYIEPNERLKIKLNTSTVYSKARKVESDLKITGKDVKVAVLDTGVNINHEGLKGQVFDSIDYTGEGIIDQNGHGSHVACIIACNGPIYRGNAPSAKILNVKTTNKDGEGDMSDTISGIEWALDNSAKIMNISLGALIDNCNGTDALSRAVDEANGKGVLMVVATGNFGPNAKTIATPGCSKKGFTVGAVDEQGKIADFSSRGPTADGRQKPDIFGPGVEITSAWFDGQYAIVDGTSQAAPHVAGIVALVLEADPSLTNDGVRSLLLSTTNKLPSPASDLTNNQGIVDAYNAISKYVKASAPEEKPEEKINEIETNNNENTTNNEETKDPNEKVEVQINSELIEPKAEVEENYTIPNLATEVTSIEDAVDTLKSCQIKAGQNLEEKQKCSKTFIDTQIEFKKKSVPEDEKYYIEKIETDILNLAKISGKLKEESKNKIRQLTENIKKTVYIGASAKIIEETTKDIISKINSGIISSKDISNFENTINEQKKNNILEKYQKNLIPFKDVEDNQWFFYFVNKVKELKIVNGYKDKSGNYTGDFGPGNLTTVAEALKMALESAGIGQSSSGSDPLNTLATNHWSKKYYLKAEELGLNIAKNTKDNPDRKISRQEFIQLQLEALKTKPLTNYQNIFTDVDTKSSYAGWIYRAYQDGVISGDSGKSTFRPGDQINRAEIAKIIIESLKKYIIL